MQRQELLMATRLEAETLEAWIAAGWLLPRGSREAGPFSEVDLARAQLIRDLEELGVNDEGIPIILDLVDQLHGLRHALRNLLLTVNTHPEHKRLQDLSAIHNARSQRRRRP
jgi:chaperone modulatory protein CbpM